MKKNYLLMRGMAVIMFSFLMFTNLSAQLYINEFMAKQDAAFPGPQNDYSDWIEIYNAGTEPVMLGGYYLSDILDDPTAMYQIPDTYPDSVTVQPGEFILFYANKGEATSVLNLNFKLGSSGEAIGFWTPESVFIDSLTYGEQTENVSYGRIIDGTDNWGFFIEHPVIGYTCSPNRSNITIRMNEFLAKNSNVNQDEFGNYGDWIELYNYGLTDIDITGMHMSDTPEDPTLYTFNPAIISPEEYILVWCDATTDDPITVPDTLHANFKLSAGGETVGFYLNANTVIDMVIFGSQTEDISYGRFPDGTNDWYTFTAPTPWESNTMVSGPIISGVVRFPMFPEFTEEVTITGTITSSASNLIAILLYSAGSEFTEVEMFDDGLHNDGAAGDNVYGGNIPAHAKGTLVSWYITASDDLPSQSFFPVDAPASTLNYKVTDWTPVNVVELTVNEPSGLDYNQNTGTLFTNNDGNTSDIYEISTSGLLLNTIVVQGNDFEGIAFNSTYDTIYVVEEANWKIIKYTLDGVKVGEIEVAHSPNPSSGLEGIAVDHLNGNIFVLHEKNNPELIELTSAGVEINRTTLNFSSDISGITIHPTWQTLFIVSDESKSLNEITKSGEHLRSWYIPLEQAEGVTFGSNDNVIYMVSDRDSKLYEFAFDFGPYIDGPALYINEFMASNDTAFPGPQGDFPDWIEIYNASNEAVDLSGYYMSDDLVDPLKMYQIPSTYPDSVTVEAGGFILFYANKGEATSVLNLNFKLGSGGEQVGLWNPDQAFVDSITYGPQTADTSYGRFVDGTANWYLMLDFTPGAANIYTSSISEINDNVSISQNFPNPFNTKTNIQFELENNDNVAIRIFDVRGALVAVLANQNYSAGTHTVIWDATNIPAGYYFYTLQTSSSFVTKKASVIK